MYAIRSYYAGADSLAGAAKKTAPQVETRTGRGCFDGAEGTAAEAVAAPLAAEFGDNVRGAAKALGEGRRLLRVTGGAMPLAQTFTKNLQSYNFV